MSQTYIASISNHQGKSFNPDCYHIFLGQLAQHLYINNVIKFLHRWLPFLVRLCAQ